MRWILLLILGLFLLGAVSCNKSGGAFGGNQPMLKGAYRQKTDPVQAGKTGDGRDIGTARADDGGKLPPPPSAGSSGGSDCGTGG